MGYGRERHRVTLQEWRIWPFLTACAGTQLAYGVLHIVVKDFFACILTLFSFIGSLCCVVSRRSEVVLANFLLQLAIFITLSICCSLGTSSMQVWHKNKQFVPLVATHIIFFFSVVILNGILLVLKKRQQQRDTVSEESAFARSKLPSRRTESSAVTYVRSPTSPQALPRLQHRKEERKLRSEEAVKHEAYSFCVPVCSDGDKPCRVGLNMLSGTTTEGTTRQKASLPSNKELLRTNQHSPNGSCGSENESEAAPAPSSSRAGCPNACDKINATSHLIIRSQQIEPAAGRLSPRAPDRSATLQTLGSKSGRNSRCSAISLIQQQNCALHGRAFSLLSTGGEIRCFDGKRETTGVAHPPAVPRLAIAEDNATETAAGAAGKPCVCLVDCEQQQNVTAMARTPYTASPRHDLMCHCRTITMPGPFSPQASNKFSLSCHPSLHSHTSLLDGANGRGYVSLEQNGIPSLHASPDKRRPLVFIKRTVRLMWERTLSYLGQPIDCDFVLAGVGKCPGELQHSVSITHATPAHSTTRKTAPKAEGITRREPPEEFLSSSHCRRTLGENSKIAANDIRGASAMRSSPKHLGKDVDREAKGKELQEHEDSTQGQYTPARQCVGGRMCSDKCESSSPALPSDLTLIKLNQRRSGNNSFANTAACTKEGFAAAAEEGWNQEAETPEVHVLSFTGLRMEVDPVSVEQSSSHTKRNGGSASATFPTNLSSAAGLNAEETAFSGEEVSGQACGLFGPSTAAAKGDGGGMNGETPLIAMNRWACLGTTAGSQAGRPALEVKTEKADLDFALESPSSKHTALCDNRSMLRSRAIEILAQVEEAALVETLDMHNVPPRSNELENNVGRSEVESTHGTLRTSIMKDAGSNSQNSEASGSTQNAVPPAETFNRLPADTITAADECIVPDGRARDAPLSDMWTTVGEHGPSAEAGTMIRERFPATVKRAASPVTVEQVSPICVDQAPNGKELLYSAHGDSNSFAGQSWPKGSKCTLAGGGYTGPGERSFENVNHAYSRKSEVDQPEAWAAKEPNVNMLSPEKNTFVDAQNTIDVSCEHTGTAETDSADATDAATRLKSSALQAQYAYKWDDYRVLKSHVGSSGGKLNTAISRPVGEAPMSRIRKKASKEATCGGAVSREKVVYRGHLVRGRPSNTRPKVEEEDSWEDESEGVESQI